MKKLLVLIIGLFVLFSCETPLAKEKVESTYDNGQPKMVSYVQQIDGKEEVVEQQFYFKNGQLKMEGKISKDKRDGLWKAYFEDGTLQSEGEFKEGLRTGLAKVYHPNGKLMYEGQYKDDEEVGLWKFYNEEGKLVKEKDF